MNNKRPLINFIILSIALLFFLFFSPSYFIRYISLFFIGAAILINIYVLLIPQFIRVRHLDSAVRGIKLQEMEIKLEVKNVSPIPIPYFTINDATGELFAEEHSFMVNLRPFETKVIRFVCKGHQRGEFFLGPVQMKGSDPLGYLTWKKRVDTRLRVLVYPSIYRMDLKNDRGLPAGSLNINNKMYEDVTQFRSLREYVPGDDMKRINWKASAKTGKLFTMEFDSTLYFPVLIVLNFSVDDYPVRYRNLLVERAAEVSASLAFYFANLKQEIGFITSGAANEQEGNEEGIIRVQSKSGYEHAQEILEVIATLKPRKGGADFNNLLFQSGASIPMGARVMVVSPRIRENQANTLIAATRKGTNIHVLQLESSSERRDEDFVKGALRVISIKESGQDTINE
ncbi:MAG: DUF58 domain-containing protein [Spirochaetales bacterium]|jgi:uncharacterized protein (DUF58 family)|nr:DUF58 domain-containing protein [Spirochaetales bacterium]